MNQNPEEFYKERIKQFESQLKRLSRIITIISFSRLGAFLLIVFSIALFTISNKILACSLFASSVMGMLTLVKYHLKLEEKKKLTEILLEINNNELKYLDFDFLKFPDGSAYDDVHHPFVTDLNIFGSGSLYQYINRTTTPFGQMKFSELLAGFHTEVDNIRSRQDMCKEMASKPEWRQAFQAAGKKTEMHGNEIEELSVWLQEPFLILNRNKMKLLLILLPALTIGSLVFGFISGIYLLAKLVFSIQIIFLLSWQRKLNKVHEKLSRKHLIFQQYSELLEIIEKEVFLSVVLKKHREVLAVERNSAAKQVKELADVLNAFDRRLNIMVSGILNAVYLADLWNLLRLEKWKEQNFENIQKWFNTIGEFEAFASLGNYAFNNPGYAYSELSKNTFEFHAVQLGHPLIDSKKRVCNDFMVGSGVFTIITGANMAGKSTFLRSVGLNMILGMTGAPVCATSFKFSPLQVMTSISVKDSLVDNESYFYAELKRLKMIIDALNRGEKIFIILDEILKGTNSEDKLKGSKALLKQFIHYATSGIVATHDLSLSELENQFPGNIINHSFEVELDGDRLYYDYKLHKGRCKNLNASFLMKKMGIILD
jgi:DNA mismatch repair ATPase MutS